MNPRLCVSPIVEKLFQFLNELMWKIARKRHFMTQCHIFKFPSSQIHFINIFFKGCDHENVHPVYTFQTFSN